MNICFLASSSPEAQAAKAELEKLYGQSKPRNCDVFVALGGDGYLLETLHKHIELEKPVYGMNCGSVGFLLNNYSLDDLPNRIQAAQHVKMHPLRMTAHTKNDDEVDAIAFNEVSLLRQTRQAAKLCIKVDRQMRLPELVCDGVMVATPAGSTAYNLSAHGPIIPLEANVLAMTPISAFRPRRWRGALLSCHARITIDVLESDKRPVSATADFTEVRNVTRVEIRHDDRVHSQLLFDPDHNLEERILSEQFEV